MLTLTTMTMVMVMVGRSNTAFAAAGGAGGAGQEGVEPEVEDATLAVVELGVFFVLLVLVLMHLLKKRHVAHEKRPQHKAHNTAAHGPQRTEQLQAAIQQAFGAAARREGRVVLRLPVAQLPRLDTAYEAVKELTLPIASSDIDLTPLSQLPNLHTLALSGPPLRLEHLRVLKSLPSLRRLRLAESRVVVDANNSIQGFCKPKDVFEFARKDETRAIEEMELPDTASVEVGRIVKVFKKSNVVVLAVLRSIAVDDVIYFRRTTQQFSADAHSSHIWTSKKSRVAEIRTDDHDRLQIAEHNDSIPDMHIDNQVSVHVAEVGRAGDSVMWCGKSKHDPSS